ncbi:glucose 1-dehydrogenase [Algihabitans albus]|uniref:glucose 1-dehydrogenase n=1 Tax=Algihabitans albus TaxID=2164067 RepID=UPI000E5CFDD5|nr:glucose 1-dehydrogenase [Algihabitans albus]
MRLADKVAIVTGGGSGFGAGIARRFAIEGAQVIVADIDRAAAESVLREIGGNAVAVEADVTQRDQVARMIDTAVDQFGKLDILVNNAGYSHRNAPLLEITEADYDLCFDVNVKAIFHAAQLAVPVFREQGGGVIVNTSSTAGLRPRPGLTWYNATKGAVNTLTKSLAVELAPDRIRVNAICPVIGETGLLETFMGVADTPDARAKFVATIPLGRLSTPQDIATAAVFLASDEAAFITGVLMEVDGGRCV